MTATFEHRPFIPDNSWSVCLLIGLVSFPVVMMMMMRMVMMINVILLDVFLLFGLESCSVSVLAPWFLGGYDWFRWHCW